MSDTLDKVLRLQQAYVGKNYALAKTIFTGLAPSDFPEGMKFPMSNGILADVDGWFFYVDHDWSDWPEWVEKFIQNMITALQDKV